MIFAPDTILQYYRERLDKFQRSGSNQASARCPFHDDSKPSLSINLNNGLWKCHGCEAYGDIVGFEALLRHCDRDEAKESLEHSLGAALSKLGNQQPGAIVTIYPYTNENGSLLYEVIRYLPKTFRVRRRVGDRWEWGLGDTAPVLYNLPAVLASDEVIVVEGERDVETLRKLGYVATTSPFGAGKYHERYSKYLEGKTIYVVPDNDPPGKKHAALVVESVRKYAASVRLLEPLPDAKDATEWVERGGKKKEFRELLESAEVSKKEPDDKATKPLPAGDWRDEPLRGHWIVALLEQFFLDYLVLAPGVAFVAAIWVIGTHIFDAFDCFPYLAVTSPTKRCGKTRFAEILELFCARPLSTVGISSAALFRSIEADRPTVIIDEAESLRNKDNERGQSLNAILNAGFKQGAYVPRCVGSDHEVRKFAVFSPKIIIAIGSLPETLADRSIAVSMRRHLSTEPVFRFRRRSAEQDADGIQHALSCWVTKYRDGIAQKYSKQSIDFLSDREADLWEPLFAIAEISVPERMDELKRIAVRLAGQKAKADCDDAISIRLLEDLRAVFSVSTRKKLPTQDVLTKLTHLPESSWDELTPIKLARLLRPFGVWPRQLGFIDSNPRGYDLADFTSVFERYLPPQ